MPLSSTRKKSARPPMTKRSPYKARKSTAKASSTAKKLAPTRKAVGKSVTKEERLRARARAREWAKKELGGRKSSPAPPAAQPKSESSGILVIDDDSDEEVKAVPTANVAKAGCGKCTLSCERCKSIGQKMLELGIENAKLKKSVKEEDVFYDALEALPGQGDVAVEDVSDDEDEEIRDLRSSLRNLIPGRGQSWMEPLEPEGHSFSTWKKNCV